jgi:hypothetical protein
MQDKTFKINLKIAGKRYPMWCLRSEDGAEEKIYRDAERNINDKLLLYRVKYPYEDSCDYMTMSAIHISAQNERIKKIHDKSVVFEQLEKLTKEIDDFLKE